MEYARIDLPGLSGGVFRDSSNKALTLYLQEKEFFVYPQSAVKTVEPYEKNLALLAIPWVLLVVVQFIFTVIFYRRKGLLECFRKETELSNI